MELYGFLCALLLFVCPGLFWWAGGLFLVILGLVFAWAALAVGLINLGRHIGGNRGAKLLLTLLFSTPPLIAGAWLAGSWLNLAGFVAGLTLVVGVVALPAWWLNHWLDRRDERAEPLGSD